MAFQVFNENTNLKKHGEKQQASKLDYGHKHSTEHLEFPLNVANGDTGLGNHGHYIMFFVNKQEKSVLKTSDYGVGMSMSEDISRYKSEYGIPEYITKYDTLKEKYVEKPAGNEVAKKVNGNFYGDPELKLPHPGEDMVKPKLTGPRPKSTVGSTNFIKRAATRRLKTGIAMYMPASVNVTYGANYTDTDMGAVTEQALEGYNALVNGRFKDALGNVLDMDEGASELLEKFMLSTIGAVPGLAGLKGAYEAKQGAIISDRLELAFKGINKRNFQYTFKMIPKNQQEAEMIRKIIFTFKSNMLPEFLGGNRTGRRMIVPNTFDIQYMFGGKPNAFLHHISTCVLENMSVSYGGDRYKTFDPTEDGAPPVETSVTLAFKEMELITRERVHEGF